jgi:GTP 3',8-cyclase
LAVYANANLSIYSAQSCNGRCRFCVEELRPASRGVGLAGQKLIEPNDARYFSALEQVLTALRPLQPSVSVTGGEPSKDPRLPRILRTIQAYGARKRTITTNGSGLLDEQEGRRLIDWLTATGVSHLNISRAHPEASRNSSIMNLDKGPTLTQLREVVRRAASGGTRVRLSCVLLKSEIDSLQGIQAYLAFAEEIGVDNVIFRQLMKTDNATACRNSVVLYSDDKRVCLEPLLDALSQHRDFLFQRQIMGYYYYVEVWKYRNIDVVFEEADLAQLERTKRTMPGVIHELVFHPNARLGSTWQPWDGVMGPPVHQRPERDMRACHPVC